LSSEYQQKEGSETMNEEAEKIKRIIEQGYINALTEVLKILMKEEEKRNQHDC
jgi:RNA polymerase-interacting CarD/CdnL/TRCF family regulator